MTVNKQDTLRPADLAVAVSIAVSPMASQHTFAQLGETLGVSTSSAFEAVQRLQRAGLLRPGTREPNRHALRNFLAHGVRCAFPPLLGREVRGVPTAHAGPELSTQFDSAMPFVWPDPQGSARGTALTPLFPQATALPERAPAIYNALTLVDALRVGQARERNAALAALDRLMAAGDAGFDG